MGFEDFEGETYKHAQFGYKRIELANGTRFAISPAGLAKGEDFTQALIHDDHLNQKKLRMNRPLGGRRRCVRKYIGEQAVVIKPLYKLPAWLYISDSKIRRYSYSNLRSFDKIGAIISHQIFMSKKIEEAVKSFNCDPFKVKVEELLAYSTNGPHERYMIHPYYPKLPDRTFLQPFKRIKKILYAEETFVRFIEHLYKMGIRSYDTFQFLVTGTLNEPEIILYDSEHWHMKPPYKASWKITLGESPLG